MLKIVSFILNRYLENGAKRSDVIRTDLLVEINENKYRLSHVICRLDDGKHSLFIIEDDGVQFNWLRTNGDNLDQISAATFGEITKKSGIVYTYNGE